MYLSLLAHLGCHVVKSEEMRVSKTELRRFRRLLAQNPNCFSRGVAEPEYVYYIKGRRRSLIRRSIYKDKIVICHTFWNPLI